MCHTLPATWDSEMSKKVPQLQKAQSLCKQGEEQAELTPSGKRRKLEVEILDTKDIDDFILSF